MTSGIRATKKDVFDGRGKIMVKHLDERQYRVGKVRDHELGDFEEGTQGAIPPHEQTMSCMGNLEKAETF